MKGTRGREGAFAGAWRLGLAGFFAIAVAFGPARSGFGLFLPDFRREFGLSTEVSGVIAGGSYGGYLVALSLVGLFAARFGPRLFVTVGGISATTGMILVAIAPNAPLLATGLILAASYAGWSWSPYNDAVEREVPSRWRGRVLSAISTGTTFGLAMAGLIALAAGVWGCPGAPPGSVSLRLPWRSQRGTRGPCRVGPRDPSRLPRSTERTRAGCCVRGR